MSERWSLSRWDRFQEKWFPIGCAASPFIVIGAAIWICGYLSRWANQYRSENEQAMQTYNALMLAWTPTATATSEPTLTPTLPPTLTPTPPPKVYTFVANVGCVEGPVPTIKEAMAAIRQQTEMANDVTAICRDNLEECVSITSKQLKQMGNEPLAEDEVICVFDVQN